MAIIARELDNSEKKTVVVQTHLAMAAGTYGHYIAPGPLTIDAVQVAAFGVTSTPNFQLAIRRVAAAGATTILVGGTLVMQAASTSGPQGVSLPAAGSTLLQLNTGDVVSFVSAGFVADLTVELVVRTLQDIRSVFGSST